MSADTLKIKERLTARGNFTEEQAEDIIEAMFRGDDEVVTRGILQEELSKFTVRILLGVVAIDGLFLAAVSLF